MRPPGVPWLKSCQIAFFKKIVKKALEIVKKSCKALILQEHFFVGFHFFDGICCFLRVL